MSYQNVRGGSIVLQDVKAPSLEWESHTKVLEESLSMEKKINESLVTLYKIAEEKHDAHLCHHFNESLIKEGVDTINEIGKLVTNAKRCGNDLGLYLFDKNSMS